MYHLEGNTYDRRHREVGMPIGFPWMLSSLLGVNGVGLRGCCGNGPLGRGIIRGIVGCGCGGCRIV